MRWLLSHDCPLTSSSPPSLLPAPLPERLQATGTRIVTIEGLARDGVMHPMQQAFHEHHALQCGFCTPGMLITAIDFLNDHRNPDETQVREAMSAVICRCTGYQGIVNAVLAVSRQPPTALPE